MGIAYRLQQFWRLIRVQPFPQEAWAEVQAVLSPQELALFRQQVTADQTHGLRVLRTLREAGESDPHLLAAALLHDVGKCRVRPTLWDRVVGALVEKLAPARAAAWGQGRPTRLRRPFVIRQQHAAWGAEMAREAGSAPLTVRLIALHQQPLETAQDETVRRLLERLQWADDQN